MQIPGEMRAGLDRLLEGVARGVLTERAERMSSLYRKKAGSTVAVRDGTDALAYAITRSPATYGAVRNVLERLTERIPEFCPRSALDLGTGAGAASWALCETWPQIEWIAQVDCNVPLLNLNRTIAHESSCPALRAAEQITADVTRIPELPSADIVLLSYMLAELADAPMQSVLETAWDRCTGAMIIVEPGTPAGYRKILAARRFVLENGGRILAPCPHEQACPLIPPDWCHFVQRVERSRDHRILKLAALPYEDEKFSYVVGVRAEHFLPASMERILARPEKDKSAITMKLCRVNGTAELVMISRRDKDQYRRAKKRDWGDEL